MGCFMTLTAVFAAISASIRCAIFPDQDCLLGRTHAQTAVILGHAVSTGHLLGARRR